MNFYLIREIKRIWVLLKHLKLILPTILSVISGRRGLINVDSKTLRSQDTLCGNVEFYFNLN